MLTLFHLIVIYLVLLLISFASKNLHPMLYAAVFFFFLAYMTVTIVIPFGKTFMQLFATFPKPYPQLLIGSVFLFYLSEMIAGHIAEAGYGSIAAVARLAIKIAILSLWLPQLSEMIDALSKLIIK